MPTSKQVRNIVLIKVHRRGNTYGDFRIRFPLVCMQHQQQIDGLLNNAFHSANIGLFIFLLFEYHHVC